MKNKVPERWEDYKSMGRPIPGTRFICFKVPLREEILRNAVRRGAEWFCPRTLMDHCHHLGLIVDLTFTDRFYDPQTFTNQGIKYCKILTQGKIIPKAPVIKEFFKIVNTFLDENKENEKLIGVHCTHGLNRTGYLVCRYMIEHLGIPPDQAISDFNSARGHEQERPDYLEHLRQMKWLEEPSLPDSDKEEEQTEKTPTPTQRRTKRNFDAIRDEDDNDESWPSGPVRKWPRTPHHHRSNHDQYYGHNSGNTPAASSSRWSSRSPRHETKASPYQGQRYYDSHYRGRVAPQYDTYFYKQRGSGVGPHRHSPRWSRNVHWDNAGGGYGRPRQYQGPRHYRTPRRERETLDNPYITTPVTERNPATPDTPSMEGPRRNPFSPGPSMEGPRRNPFSPGASDNVFSPTTPRYHRYRK